MSNKKLRAEIAALRAELGALREGLAEEIHTRRIVVAADAGRYAEVEPGLIMVSDPVNGCHVVLSAYEDRAEMDLVAGDVTPPRVSGITQSVNLLAWVERDCEPGGPHSEVLVNGVEVAVAGTLSS